MLSREQLQELSQKLAQEKTSLTAELKNLNADAPPQMGDDVDHFEEEADEAEEFTTNIGIANTLKERLRNIERASSKMAKGAYGKCEQCGSEIDFELLSVNPESRLCRACKANG